MTRVRQSQGPRTGTASRETRRSPTAPAPTDRPMRRPNRTVHASAPCPSKRRLPASIRACPRPVRLSVERRRRAVLRSRKGAAGMRIIPRGCGGRTAARGSSQPRYAAKAAMKPAMATRATHASTWRVKARRRSRPTVRVHTTETWHMPCSAVPLVLAKDRQVRRCAGSIFSRAMWSSAYVKRRQGERSPGADVAGVSAVPAQMWQG